MCIRDRRRGRWARHGAARRGQPEADAAPRRRARLEPRRHGAGRRLLVEMFDRLGDGRRHGREDGGLARLSRGGGGGEQRLQ
eukprot:6952449-Prymnesium_polylepis.1